MSGLSSTPSKKVSDLEFQLPTLAPLHATTALVGKGSFARSPKTVA